jgi:FixJ family two-component response regulator
MQGRALPAGAINTVPNTNKVITVVDDDQSMSRMLSRVLTTAGFEVVSYASAEEYIDSKDSKAADCLVLDMNLPGMSGAELQQLLIHRGVEIPIIFISADANEIAQQQVLDAGGAAFLSKPFNIESLLEKIRSVALLTLS